MVHNTARSGIARSSTERSEFGSSGPVHDVNATIDSPSSGARPGARNAADPPVDSAQLGLGPLRPLTLAERIEAAVVGLERFRERPAIITVVLLAIAGVVVGLPILRATDDPRPVEDLIPNVALTPTTAAGRASVDVVVHVSGAIASPGVYSVPATARVIDAVEKAGGATVEADLDQLNLAAVVVDGQQIRIPRVGEVLPAAPASGAPAVPVDLNRADVAALQSLRGIGPATAEAIVAFREQNGPFQTVDDLLDVPGIGPAKLAVIVDAIVVR